MKSHILICDDEWVIRNTLLHVAGEVEGVRATAAANGAEALDIFRRDRPDGMIIDICMPVIDGLELLRICREELHSDLPVVVLSGYDRFEYAQRAINYGVMKYMLKPMLRDEIYQMIVLLRDRAASSPEPAPAEPFSAVPTPADAGQPEQELAPDDARVRKIVSAAMTYIERSYMRDISVGEIAQSLDMSRNYFGQLFKASTGMAVSEYINFVRIEHAKLLLKSTNLKIYEIAEKVGFDDSFYFSNVFKKVTGSAPKNYREC